ncbi:unnamed protein product [Anisakis simplex]|uniref:Girdin n=1 Tax=Anisakis simplex TaxID=6269 RepID=A0A0M3JAI8_ANISI|nr:unnamed protein product [Anisakis simplex]
MAESRNDLNECIQMTDWDASTVVAANVSSTSTQNGNNPSVEELKEALEMVTEKTEECEELRRQKCEIEKEFELRQTYIEELMAQTNALQLQQQTQADAFSEMRERANKIDCEKLEMERNLIQVREQLEESTRKMDELKDENMKLASLLKKSESVSHSHDEEKLAEIDELKKRLADNEKHYQDELSTQKYQVIFLGISIGF